MTTDKEIAIQIIDQMEKLFLEVCVLSKLLDKLNISDWKLYRDQAMTDPVFLSLARKQFDPLRDQVLAAPDLTEGVRGILQGLEESEEH